MNIHNQNIIKALFQRLLFKRSKKCVESVVKHCKYPVTCGHHKRCMEKLVIESNKRREEWNMKH